LSGQFQMVWKIPVSTGTVPDALERSTEKKARECVNTFKICIAMRSPMTVFCHTPPNHS